MGENKKTRTNYNETVLQELIKKYGVTRDYIYKSIRGERTGTIPIKIQGEYQLLDKASKSTVKNKINEI